MVNVNWATKKMVSKKLIHYSTPLPSIVVCDTLLYGSPAILSLKYSNISEGSIVLASRPLSPAEKNMSTDW